MKSIIIIFSLVLLQISAPLCANEHTETNAQIKELDERITNLELGELAQKINLGLDLKVMSNHFNSEGNQKTGSTQKNSITAHALLFRLNLNAKIHDELSVYSSLESFTLFNDNLLSNLSPVTYSDSRNQRNDEKPRVSKAYFDWHIVPRIFTFSAGRLPTTQGPPTHLADGNERTGTYPTTNYSVPLDGFAGTFKIHSLSDFFDKNQLTLRAIYHPGTSTDDISPWRGRPIAEDNAPEQLAKNHKLFSGMLEYEHKDLPGFFKNFLCILQYGNYKFGSMAPLTKTVKFGAAGYWPADLYLDNDTMMRVEAFSQYLEVNNIAESRFDIYGTWQRTKAKSEANVWAQPLPSAVAGGAPFNLTAQRIGPFIMNGEKVGWRYVAGTKYSLKDDLFIGGEWSQSTADALVTALWSDDIYNIAYQNGRSYHGYLTKTLYKKQFVIRGGYVATKMNKDLEDALTYKDSQEKIRTVYLNFLIRI